MLRAGFTLYAVGRKTLSPPLKLMLQLAFIILSQNIRQIVLSSFPKPGFHHLGALGIARVQINRPHNCFEGIGQDRGLLAAAGL
jgi:hypothetical protein